MIFRKRTDRDVSVEMDSLFLQSPSFPVQEVLESAKNIDFGLDDENGSIPDPKRMLREKQEHSSAMQLLASLENSDQPEPDEKETAEQKSRELDSRPITWDDLPGMDSSALEPATEDITGSLFNGDVPEEPVEIMETESQPTGDANPGSPIDALYPAAETSPVQTEGGVALPPAEPDGNDIEEAVVVLPPLPKEPALPPLDPEPLNDNLMIPPSLRRTPEGESAFENFVRSLLNSSRHDAWISEHRDEGELSYAQVEPSFLQIQNMESSLEKIAQTKPQENPGLLLPEAGMEIPSFSEKGISAEAAVAQELKPGTAADPCAEEVFTEEAEPPAQEPDSPVTSSSSVAGEISIPDPFAPSLSVCEPVCCPDSSPLSHEEIKHEEPELSVVQDPKPPPETKPKILPLSQGFEMVKVKPVAARSPIAVHKVSLLDAPGWMAESPAQFEPDAPQEEMKTLEMQSEGEELAFADLSENEEMEIPPFDFALDLEKESDLAEVVEDPSNRQEIPAFAMERDDSSSYGDFGMEEAPRFDGEFSPLEFSDSFPAAEEQTFGPAAESPLPFEEIETWIDDNGESYSPKADTEIDSSFPDLDFPVFEELPDEAENRLTWNEEAFEEHPEERGDPIRFLDAESDEEDGDETGVEIRASAPLVDNFQVMLVHHEGVNALMVDDGVDAKMLKSFDSDPFKEDNRFIVTQEAILGSKGMFIIQVGTWQGIIAIEGETVILQAEID